MNTTQALFLLCLAVPSFSVLVWYSFYSGMIRLPKKNRNESQNRIRRFYEPHFYRGESYSENEIEKKLNETNFHVVFYARYEQFRLSPKDWEIVAIIYNDKPNNRYIPINGKEHFEFFTEYIVVALKTAKSYIPQDVLVEVVYVNPNSREGKKLAKTFGQLFGGI